MVRVPLLVPALAVLVLALAACSSRPSQDSGPLALKPPFADPVIEVGAAEAPDAPLKRDIAFLEDYLMSMRIIEKCIDFLIKGIREDGAVPDRVQVEGRPIYAAGSPETPLGEPNIDNAQFLVFAVSSYLDMVPADRHKFLYRKWSSALKRGMNYIPLAASGVVWNDPTKPHSPYGFTDTVAKTGELFMESLLYWRASMMLSRWEGIYGSEEGKEAWAARARAIEKSIVSLWDDKTGMFIAASRDCRQTDIWGNAYAVYIDFPPISRLWHALKLLEIQDQRPLQNSLSSRLQ